MSATQRLMEQTKRFVIVKHKQDQLMSSNFFCSQSVNAFKVLAFLNMSDGLYKSVCVCENTWKCVCYES